MRNWGLPTIRKVREQRTTGQSTDTSGTFWGAVLLSVQRNIQYRVGHIISKLFSHCKMLQYIHPFTQRGLAMLNGCSVAALVRLYYSFILSLKRLWVDGYVFRGIRVCACKIISVFLQAFFFVTWRTTRYTEYTELLTDCRLNHNHKLQSIFPVAPCSPFPLSTSVYVCCFCAFTCKLS